MSENEIKQAVRELAASVNDDPMDASQHRKLKDLTAILEATQALIDQEVKFARELGTTWAVIGDALGVSRQAAQQQHKTR